MITITSFSYWHGEPEGALVIDCRKLPNPHNVPELAALDGRHARVKAYVMSEPAGLLLAEAANYVDETGDDASVAFGCVGGKHRSVAMAEFLAAALKVRGKSLVLTHRMLT